MTTAHLQCPHCRNFIQRCVACGEWTLAKDKTCHNCGSSLFPAAHCEPVTRGNGNTSLESVTASTGLAIGAGSSSQVDQSTHYYYSDDQVDKQYQALMSWASQGRRTKMRHHRVESRDFSNVDLRSADLKHGIFASSKFIGADLQQADLCETDLRSTLLLQACLDEADLSFAVLDGADLTEASLVAANLEHASLLRANLIGVNLSYANLVGANLSHADLRRANLSGAYLDRATLHGANLARADFSDVRLIQADITTEQLQLLRFLRGAIMPNGRSYCGCFRLPGDTQWAVNFGVDIKDPVALASFYEEAVDLTL